MIADPPTDADDSNAAPEPGHGVPEAKQRINSAIFIINNSLNYLVGPVLYVGIVHAAILKAAGASDSFANLPSSVYTSMAPLPVLVAWLWPSSSHFGRLWILSYVVMGAAGLLVAGLCWGAPPSWQMTGLVLHAALIGAANGVMNMSQWDMLGRSLTPQRKAWTLKVTFGAGPILAVLGSCAANLILSGNFLNLVQEGRFLNLFPVAQLEQPWNYIVLFGATGPAMLLAALCAAFATLPPSSIEEIRPSVAQVRSGLREYFTNRLIVIALIGFLLTSAGGNLILPNLGLYVEDITGNPAEDYAGVQLALRFGCKSLFGFVLGWLLSRFHPKAPVLATTLFCVSGIVWALAVPGEWYLFSFGLLGAGELSYVYYINYIVSSSPARRVRENTSYTILLSAVVGFTPQLYGWVSDNYGLRASFWVALAILVVTVAIVGLRLPRQPRVESTLSGGV